jgi:hypothetical protein
MLYEEILYRLAIFGFKDVIEIFSISAGLYYFSMWLKQDKQKSLVLYFYSINSLMIAGHLASLPTLNSALTMLYPSILMLFIVIHQRSLQKNFVTLKNIQPAQITNHNWLEILLRSCIIAANNKRQISCLIEGHDTLNELVSAPFEIKSTLQPELLDALLTSTSYNQHKMIWLSSTGVLLGINTEWQLLDSIVDNPASELDDWQRNCLLFTTKTDALAFRLNPLTKKFDIVTEGVLLEKIPTDQAIKLMRKHFIKKDLSKNRRNHDQSTKINLNQQLSS